MISRRSFGWMLVVFGCVPLAIGAGVFFSDKFLLQLCLKTCWLNSLLLTIFGERGGKIMLSLVWFCCAGIFFRVAYAEIKCTTSISEQ